MFAQRQPKDCYKKSARYSCVISDNTYTFFGEYSGDSILYPSTSLWYNLSSVSIPGYGVLPKEKNSHRTIPNDQTSDCVEKILSLIDSIAIHFTGRRHYKKNEIATLIMDIKKKYLSTFFVIITFVHAFCQTEITYFDDIIVV